MIGRRRCSVVVCECLALIMLVLVTGCQTLEQKEIALLQGTWLIEENPVAGSLTISGNNFEIKADSDKIFVSGTVKINPEAAPKEIDMTFDKHSINEGAIGKTALGIYKIEDNKLFLATNKPGTERTEKLEKSKGNTFGVFTKQ